MLRGTRQDQDSWLGNVTKPNTNMIVNHIEIAGNLSNNPTFFPANGNKKAYLEFTLAYNGRAYRTAKGGPLVKPDAAFIKVKFFGEQAERISNRKLGVGSLLYVFGELSMDSWKDEKTQTPRSRLVVIGHWAERPHVSKLNLCKLTISAYVHGSPELRYTTGGTAVTELRCGHFKPDYKVGNATVKQNPVFINVKEWAARAENHAKFLDDKSQILISGELAQDNWEDKGSGQKRSRLYIKPDDIGIIYLNPISKSKTSDKRQNEDSDTMDQSSVLPEDVPVNAGAAGLDEDVPF